jgi:glycosyltransferase involved in cell wall biosynthesis
VRLLILLGGQIFSGAEITTLRFASALSKQWNISVAAHPVSMNRAADWPFRHIEWAHESAPGDTLLRASHFAQPPPFNKRLDEIISDVRPDIVLACMFPVAMLALPVLQKHSIPLLIHHQLMYKDLPDHPITGAVRRAANFAHTIIAASHAVEKPLLRAGIENVVVIPAGIPASYGTPHLPAVVKPRVLSIGTWGPVKGLETLLEAAAQLLNEGFDFDLHIVGPLDRYSRAYAEQIRRIAHPAIHFSSETSTPENYYRDADILVVPSSEPDPYPTVTLEGMAHQLAVIATDCGGLSEQVVHNETGLLIPPKDVPAMAAALRQLILDPEQTASMGRAGEKRVRTIADVEKQAALMGNIMRKTSGSRISSRQRIGFNPRARIPGNSSC